MKIIFIYNYLVILYFLIFYDVEFKVSILNLIVEMMIFFDIKGILILDIIRSKGRIIIFFYRIYYIIFIF